MGYVLHTFFYKQHQTKTGEKNQVKAKEHPATKLLLLENFLLSFLSFAFFWSPKITGRILKKFAKKQVC